MFNLSIDQLAGPLIGGATAFLISSINWVWSLSGRTATLAFLEQRVEALEKSSIARDGRINEMAERLARIEGLMTTLVNHFKGNNA